MRNKLTSCEQVETRLDAQAQTMTAIVDNIRSRLPWLEWSEHDRAVFIATLRPMDQNAREELGAGRYFYEEFLQTLK